MTVASLTDAVWAALSTVRDPELDEPITDLNFVTESTLEGAAVRVRLRLPTYFCAPNFAYLMVVDAHDAVLSVPGVESVDVRLMDHFAAEEINAGVAAGDGFAAAFPRQAQDDLEQLRMTFRHKAYLASLELVCSRLLRDGYDVGQLTEHRLGDLPDTLDVRRLLRRRTDIGLACDTEQLLLVDERGQPVAAAEVVPRLRFARTVRVSIEGNAGFCRGLLQTRYGPGEHAG
jgi:metal-sulfur cluster biosynthetic enzyme